MSSAHGRFPFFSQKEGVTLILTRGLQAAHKSVQMVLARDFRSVLKNQESSLLALNPRFLCCSNGQDLQKMTRGGVKT